MGYLEVTQWKILDMFDGKLDFLVFTTYLEVHYSTPGSIPDDYYGSIYNYVPSNPSDRKLSFFEMGWNSENLISVTGEATVSNHRQILSQRLLLLQIP